MVWTIDELEHRLDEIKTQRKSGNLDTRGYYRSLLQLAVELASSLLDELEQGEAHMQDQDVRKQIPLLLTFVEDQIGRFRAREDAR